MWLTPDWILAICAGVTLLIMWTGVAIGAVLWIKSEIGSMKKEILADFDTKHQANEIRVKALDALVMRHDLILAPEFNGAGHHHRRS